MTKKGFLSKSDKRILSIDLQLLISKTHTQKKNARAEISSVPFLIKFASVILGDLASHFWDTPHSWRVTQNHLGSLLVCGAVLWGSMFALGATTSF